MSGKRIIAAAAGVHSMHPAPSAAPQATEGGHETLSEVLVHEAVGDGVAAGGHVGQQVEQRLHHGADVTLGRGRVEDDPGHDDVGRGPEDKELHHDHKQHLDDSLLGRPGLLAVGLAHGAVRLQPAPERPAHGAVVRVAAFAGCGDGGLAWGGSRGSGGGRGCCQSSTLHGERDAVLAVVAGRPAILLLSF